MDAMVITQRRRRPWRTINGLVLALRLRTRAVDTAGCGKLAGELVGDATVLEFAGELLRHVVVKRVHQAPSRTRPCRRNSDAMNGA